MHFISTGPLSEEPKALLSLHMVRRLRAVTLTADGTTCWGTDGRPCGSWKQNCGWNARVARRAGCERDCVLMCIPRSGQITEQAAASRPRSCRGPQPSSLHPQHRAGSAGNRTDLRVLKGEEKRPDPRQRGAGTELHEEGDAAERGCRHPRGNAPARVLPETKHRVTESGRAGGTRRLGAHTHAATQGVKH